MIFESKRDKERFFKRGKNTCTPHFHSSTEILYVISGEKKAIVDNKEYMLKSGDVLVCPAYHVHCFPPMKSENQSIVVTIRQEDCVEFYEYCQNYQPVSLVVKEQESEFISLLSVFETNANSLLLKGAMYGLLGLFLQRTEFIKSTVKHDKTFVSMVASFIHENYSKQISLQEIANLFGYSRTYFCALFKKNFGVGFSEYLNSVRVKKSLKLLNEQNSSSVYLYVGFNSPQQYYLNFKRYYGKSPKEYLKSKES